MEFLCDKGGIATLLPAPGGGHVGANRVDCLMSMYEPLVYDAICDFLPDNARAAEIGCFKGGSTCILWNGMRRRGKRLTLVSHDLFEPFEADGGVHDIEKIFDANTASWKVRPIKVKGDSTMTHSVHVNGSLDYVFIDGDHSYDGALADILNFIPKLKPDGWMFIQDSIDGVKKAVEDSIGNSRLKIIVEPPVGHYVTIIGPRDALMEYGKRLSDDVDRVDSPHPQLGEHMSFMPV